MSFEQARYNMVVQQVRPWYVWDERVLSAMQKVARENFVPHEFGRLAYSDMDIPLSHHEIMLPPKIVARALDNLCIQPDATVLEIGTGTGYITALLLSLCQQVVSIEIEPEFYEWAQTQLHRFPHSGLTLEQGDGVMGWPKQGPYDAIFVTGTYPEGVPKKVCEQLKPQGRLIAFCGESSLQEAVLIVRNGQTFTTTSLFECKVPALKNAHQQPKFVF